MENLSHVKRVLVLGGGKSGMGAAILAKEKNMQVLVVDHKEIEEKYKNIFQTKGIAFEENFDFQQFSDLKSSWLYGEIVIKSPGIANELPFIKNIRERKIPLLSEIAFALHFCSAKIIAITGTNGKTTSTLLCNHLLKKGHYNSDVAGNIGESFALKLSDGYCKKEFYVLEVSSFQLEDTEDFSPSVAILLNISPDHLDRYENKFENYVEAKWKITSKLKKEDFFIYNYDDATIRRKLAENPPKCICLPFSLKEVFKEGAYLEKDKIVFCIHKEKFSIETQSLKLKGIHNFYNVMSCVLAYLALKLKKDTVIGALKEFNAPSHRLESIDTKCGIEFINDSKATNVHAVEYALKSIESPIIWIAGGVDKGNKYEILNEMASKKVKAMIALGINNKKITDHFKGIIPFIFSTKTMKEALQKAYEIAKEGDKVLLSPACASFDLFNNYEDRGRKFAEEVKNMFKKA